MVIEIESLGEIGAVIGGASVVITGTLMLHWKAFVAPRLKHIFQPYTERLDAVTRVIEQKYPREYEAAQDAVARDRKLRAAI